MADFESVKQMRMEPCERVADTFQLALNVDIDAEVYVHGDGTINFKVKAWVFRFYENRAALIDLERVPVV